MKIKVGGVTPDDLSSIEQAQLSEAIEDFFVWNKEVDPEHIEILTDEDEVAT